MAKESLAPEADSPAADPAVTATQGAVKAPKKAAAKTPGTPAASGSDAASGTDPKAAKAAKGASGERRQRTRQQYSMPFLMNTLTLKSFHAQQTFTRGFGICSEAIFQLSVVMRAIATEEDAIAVDEAVDRELSVVAKDMKAELERLKQYAEGNGYAYEGVQYSLPQVFTPQITSPRSVLYLSLLRDLDLLVERLDTLWLAGAMSDKEHNQAIFQWKRRTLRVSGTIRTLVFRAIGAAQRKEIHNVQDPRVGTAIDPDKSPADGLAPPDVVLPVLQAEAANTEVAGEAVAA